MRAGDLPLAPGDRSEAAVRHILDERDARVRDWSPERHAAPDGEQVLLARLGGVRVGVPARCLSGVVASVTPAPLPGAHPALAGLFAYRGRIHSLLRAEEPLGLPPATTPPGAALILRGNACAFAVSEAESVVRAVPPGAGSRYAEAAGEGSFLWIDVDEVLAALGVTPGGPGKRRKA